MFKYIKTIHSHTVAETTKRPVYDDIYFPMGAICQLSDGYLNQSHEDGKPSYLTIEEKKFNDGKTSIDCIRLLPGMMLMVTYTPETTPIGVGDMCSFTTDSEDFVTTIASIGKDAEVVSTDGDTAIIIVN
jgi:hypothetical protein